MIKKEENKTETKDTEPILVPNDGMNTPVPDKSSTHVPSESELALIKQAESPLGNPDGV